MATLYSYGIENPIANIKTALTAKSLITEAKYDTTTDLIFTTPLTTKVIKIAIQNASDTFFYIYYGDAWTSGTTITNQVQFGSTRTSDDTRLTGVDVIADTNFFAIVWKTGTNNNYLISYVGKLDNDDVLVFSTGTDNIQNIAKDLTTNTELSPVGLRCIVSLQDGGDLLTMPLMWSNLAGAMVMNGEAFAETVGVVVSSYGGATYPVIGGSYYLFCSDARMRTSQVFSTSLLLPYTA